MHHHRPRHLQIRNVQRRSELRNLSLERKLESVHGDFEKRQQQLSAVLSAANLDPTILASVTRKLDEVLDTRNALIWDLQYSIARVSKAHNDVIRTYQAKLAGT
jgi:hypothetical protein